MVNPFSLTVEGNKLHGRGMTDCLGHVGLMTLFFKELATTKPTLKAGICCLLIAGEEGGENGVLYLVNRLILILTMVLFGL